MSGRAGADGGGDGKVVVGSQFRESPHRDSPHRDSGHRDSGHQASPYRVALAGLLRCCEPPVPGALSEFVAGAGAEQAWRAIAGRSAPAAVMRAVAPRLGELERADLDARACEDLAVAHRAGAAVLGPEDAEWPAECFAPLEWVRPFDQCSHAAVPLALYRRGGHWPTHPRGAVAVVGSRAATPYGVRVARALGAEAVAAGYTVVSGAAFGIDAAAHRGAVHAGELSASASRAVAPTVAVLACGIDRSYPAAHRPLIDAIADSGAVVSEYPPGSVPARHRFLVRNRLIAAIGEATVVVEAGRRSGSLNTATTAADLGRQVLAVPGPVTSAMSVGCHDLLRDGRAGLCTGWDDLESLLGPLRPAPNPHRVGARATDGLDLVTSRVHEALPARGTATVEALAAEAGLPAPEVLGALASLQVDGLAERRDGCWQRR